MIFIASIESHKYLCNIVMPFEDTKILGFSQYQKSDRGSFIIYLDLKCLIEQIDG